MKRADKIVSRFKKMAADPMKDFDTEFDPAEQNEEFEQAVNITRPEENLTEETQESITDNLGQFADYLSNHVLTFDFRRAYLVGDNYDMLMQSPKGRAFLVKFNNAIDMLDELLEEIPDLQNGNGE